MPSSIHIARRGFMLVMSSPSGAGKTTISRRILEEEDDIEISVSVTTRPPRSSEQDGKDYHFVDEATFQSMKQAGQFREWAHVFGHYYGTPTATIEKTLAEGRDVLFDIDWQGTQQLKQVSTGDLVSVFILPPSCQLLEERLRKRAEDDEEVVTHRMGKAADEMSHWAEYDYVLINNDLEESVGAVKSIIEAERLKRRRQLGLATFVNHLRGED